MSLLSFDRVLDYCNAIYQQATERAFNDAEVAALHAAWLKMKYDNFVQQQPEILQEFAHLYTFPDKAKKKSSLLTSASRIYTVLNQEWSELLGDRKLNKTNFRESVETLFLEGKVDLQAETESTETTEVLLYGRHKALESLESHQNKSVIKLWGFAGTGKTQLIRAFCATKDIRVIFRDLRVIDTERQLIDSIRNELGFSPEGVFIDDLFAFAQHTRLHIIIDSVGELGNEMRSFLQEFCIRHSAHKPTIFLISRRRQRLNLPKDQVWELHLQGFEQPFEFNEFFAALDLSDRDHWPQLNEMYEGNPRQLLYVVENIHNFFNGSVASYLGLNSIVICPELKATYDSFQFTDLDLDIFSLFSGENKQISVDVFDFLKKQRKTSEIFSRISFLEDLSFLYKTIENGLLSFEISPLLKAYLLEEERIEPT